jgi:hypothetical protein
MSDTDTATAEKPAKAPAPIPVPAPAGPPAQTARTHSGGWKNKFVASLVETPNEWQMLPNVSPSVVSHLKKVEVTNGALEVQSRGSHFVEGRKTRLADVYARFVPAGAALAAPPAAAEGSKSGKGR